MTIVKINLNKINAKRNLEAKSGQVNINNNVSLKNVEDMAFSTEGKKGLKFTFTFSCTYEPELGKIKVEGQVFFVENAELIDEVKASWEKDKQIPPKVMEVIINAALHKGNIQAIKVSEEIGLPSPLPLPKLRPGSPNAVQEEKKEESNEEKTE